MKTPHNRTARVFTPDLYSGVSEAFSAPCLLESNVVQALVRGMGVPALCTRAGLNKSVAGLVYVEAPRDQKEPAERLISESMPPGASAAEAVEVGDGNATRAIRRIHSLEPKDTGQAPGWLGALTIGGAMTISRVNSKGVRNPIGRVTHIAGRSHRVGNQALQPDTPQDYARQCKVKTGQTVRNAASRS